MIFFETQEHRLDSALKKSDEGFSSSAYSAFRRRNDSEALKNLEIYLE